MSVNTGLSGLLRRWFPARPDRTALAPKLAEFYARNTAYHEMTQTGRKADHPQARLLSCLIEPGETYAEIGCGGGAVCRMVAESAATVHGLDVSPVALEHAGKLCSGLPVRLACCPAEALSLVDNAVAGCYSFELLEHVWDPVAAAREMVRVTRPGGFILVSTPNRFSLDLHLPKRAGARAADVALAAVRWGMDVLTGRAYVNLSPDLDGDVYPDCDMITSIVPARYARVLESLGCRVDFWDTTYMCAHREGSTTPLDYQRNAAGRFARHFGDHVLMLAHKLEEAEE